MAFTEFYTNTGGSNLNAGSTTGTAAVFTFTSGNWVASTGVFTATGGDLSGVSVGMWASVYIDGASVGVFVGRITAVDDTLDLITVDLTAKSGTAPTDGTGTRSIKVGGAWKGPNGAENFPFSFVQNTMTNASGDFPRVNMIGGTSYDVTAVVTHATNAGPIVFQGYTTTVGDGGKAEIKGITVGASHNILTISAANIEIDDIIVSNAAATSGTSAGFTLAAAELNIRGCVAHDIRNIGFNLSSGINCTLVECEAYLCNVANSASIGAFFNGSGLTGNKLIRCIAHDNAGSNTVGFLLQSETFMLGCIADTNGNDGARFSPAAGGMVLVNCDFYNNGADGFDSSNAGTISLYIENCNFVKNGGWGINNSGSGTRNGHIVNCGFGSGTQENVSGTITGASAIAESGTVTYAADVTPWNAPTTGDFRISLAAAKGAGRGSFTETQASYTGTVAYPDIGAGQHQDSGGGGTVVVVQNALL